MINASCYHQATKQDICFLQIQRGKYFRSLIHFSQHWVLLTEHSHPPDFAPPLSLRRHATSAYSQISTSALSTIFGQAMKLLELGRGFSYLGSRIDDLPFEAIKSRTLVSLIDHGEDVLRGGVISPKAIPKRPFWTVVWQP